MHNNFECLIDETTLFWGGGGSGGYVYGAKMKMLKGLWFFIIFL